MLDIKDAIDIRSYQYYRSNRSMPTQWNPKSETKRFDDIFGMLLIYQEAFDLSWLTAVIDAYLFMIWCGCVTEHFQLDVW